MTLLEIINEMREENNEAVLTELKDSMHLRDDLGLDSLMLAELTVRIEDEYDVDIFADGIIETIGEVKGKIEGK